MIGSNKWLPERNPDDFTPIRFKMLVEVLPEKARSETIITPDTVKNGDTTRKAFWAKVVKVGNLVEGTTPGLKIVLDPSLDIMNAQRCFMWEGKHYMACDVSDIIMVMEDASEKATA